MIVLGIAGALLAIGFVVVPFVHPLPPAGQHPDPEGVWQPIAAVQKAALRIKENWFWGYILNGYTAEISGTVIKYK